MQLSFVYMNGNVEQCFLLTNVPLLGPLLVVMSARLAGSGGRHRTGSVVITLGVHTRVFSGSTALHSAV